MICVFLIWFFFRILTVFDIGFKCRGMRKADVGQCRKRNRDTDETLRKDIHISILAGSECPAAAGEAKFHCECSFLQCMIFLYLRSETGGMCGMIPSDIQNREAGESPARTRHREPRISAGCHWETEKAAEV